MQIQSAARPLRLATPSRFHSRHASSRRPSRRLIGSPQGSLHAFVAASDLFPDLEREVQESAVVIDKIMRHLSQSLFVDAAANYVTGAR